MSKKAPAVQGRRFEAVRWSVGQAAYEFGLDHRTLTKRLTRSSIEPGDDGRYSTQQITSVVWGDRESEELRKITEDADHMALKNRKEPDYEILVWDNTPREDALQELSDEIFAIVMPVLTESMGHIPLALSDALSLHPEDATLWGAVADWLDENDKPHGNLHRRKMQAIMGV